MKRTVLALLALSIAPGPLNGQDQPDVAKVYVGYFQVGFGDMAEWLQIYNEHSVPLMDALVEEGVITGHGAHIHHTGGEYNFRQAIRGNADTDFDVFWAEYLGRMAERNAQAFERANRLIRAHADEIWDITHINVSGTPARYFYDAHFQINFADMEEWNQLWAETFRPLLEAGVADGSLTGYVEEFHNTGGRFNWKVITMFDDWDVFDEFNDAIYANIPLDHRIWDLIGSHDDVLWEQMPAADGN